MRVAVYSDRFVQLYADELVIKTYYFPFGINKRIPISEIQNVYYKKQECFGDFFVTKDWGMTLTPVWWACDLKRHIHIGRERIHFNVILDVGSSIKCGFTVVDVVAFLNALRPLTSASFENHIPKSFSNEKKVPQDKTPIQPAEKVYDAGELPEKQSYFFDEQSQVVTENAENYASAPPAYDSIYGKVKLN